ncbi:MAG: hypothetical protein HY355_06115 [Armatimonadetes bacterium]|nr:hypothetical protein [Armatimonadota bacterium]
MPSGREELRRGVRHLIETASREMEALTDPTPPAPPVVEAPGPAEAVPAGPAPSRPILRLVREGPLAAAPAPPPAQVGPIAEANVASRKGVCSAYYVSRKCWEVPDAYCNTALHVCMLRECPVYHLNREQLEQRFARKFAHLW